MIAKDVKRVPLLVLDLDGTVRKGKDELGRFVNGPEDVEVFPEAVRMMEEWKARGGRIIAASNQGGIALGIVSVVQVAAAMHATQIQCGGLFDKMSCCPHHPDAADPEFARCWCRKPSPGMAIDAAMALHRETGEIYPPHLGLFVGDRPEDEACAKALSMDFMWARDWRALAATKGVQT